MGTKKNFYAVYRGRRPGIYTRWFGEGGAHAQVDGFSGAIYRGFATKAEAEKFLREKRNNTGGTKKASGTGESGGAETPANGRVVIYTDGGALGNPGPGGYGAVIDNGRTRKEIAGGYRRTTNNRMELTACIRALEALEKSSDVVLFSDSKYVVDAVTKEWAQKWRKNGWMRNKREKALNADLWERLLGLLERHRVEFRWVRGHAGNPGNERCDALVRMESARVDLPPDENYERQEVSQTETRFRESPKTKK